MTKPVKATKSIVKIISQNAESALVEYELEGLLTRCYVPSSQLNGFAIDTQVLHAGIPYGYPWEDAELKFDHKKFANHLRGDGIWTVQDALRNPQKLWGALRAALADSLSNILDVSHAENKRS